MSETVTLIIANDFYSVYRNSAATIVTITTANKIKDITRSGCSNRSKKYIIEQHIVYATTAV